MDPMITASARLGSALLASVLLLTACSGGEDDKEAKKEESSSVEPTASGTPEVEENGFTAWGTGLEYGQTARVPWSPKQKLKGAVEITLTRVEQAPMKAFDGFKLTKAQKKGAAYYVRAKVENVGNADLSGFTLPIYLDDGSDIIYPPVNIPSAFEACEPRVLPKKFLPGKSAKVCMVYLSSPDAQLRAIALQPAEGVAQIEWTGPISEPKKGKAAKRVKAAR